MSAPPFVEALAGRYRLERELGAGGMATVWLARDVRHERDVAIKVLHPELSAALGPERFLQEIALTASLQHPHILPLFDSGEADGQLFYVMPYVAGETLRARLARETQLPIADAVQLAREVADALQYAHERGVIHRDVKPENILLQGGHALVADFGIALAVQQAGGQRMTQTGLSLGTPQYMAPEQAMGEKTVDARADVYALGAVLYEMLAGEPPFTGPSAQAIVARVLTTTPAALTATRPTVPPAVERAVMTALAKLPADRQPSAAQFATALRDGAGAGVSTAVPAQPEAPAVRNAPRARGERVVAGVALASALVASGLAVWAWRGWRAARDDQPVVRFDVALGAGVQVGDVAVSRDGRTLAFAAESAGVVRLYVRALDAPIPRLVAGTGAPMPFVAFSPDAQWLAFVSDGQLWKSPVTGGQPTPLAQVGAALGVTWPRADVVVVAANVGPEQGLRRVPAGGGTPQRLTPASAGRVKYAYPRALPDGRHVAFTIVRESSEAADSLALASVETGEVSPLGVAGRPLGMVGDRLVYRAAGSGALMALPVDLEHGRSTGAPVPLGETVGAGAASAAGVLVTARDRLPARVEWARPDGSAGGAIIAQPADVADPRLSPDGRRLALAMRGTGGWEIWIQDLASGTLSRLATRGQRPEWTPDGRRIVFRDPTGVLGLASQPVDFARTAAPLAVRAASADGPLGDGVVSPDGQTLLYGQNGDFYAVPLQGGAAPRLFLQSPANNQAPRFSPDGRWVAFHSAISGRREVYVTPWPAPGPRYQVSVTGGAEPVWARDGRRLFYRDGSRLLAATLELRAAFAVTSRAVLFEGDFATDPGHAQYDVAPDGRFIVLRGTGESARLAVVLNWRGAVDGTTPR